MRRSISWGGLCGGALWLLALLQCAAVAGVSEARVAMRVQPQDWPRVRCSTVVTDADGVPTSGLGKEDFAVSEDGQEIPDFAVQPFRTTQEKVAVVLVMDRSGSMEGKPFEAAKEAARRFAARLASTDALAVVTFGGRSRTESSLTADKNAALAVLDQIHSRGRTALYDAVGQAVASLSHYLADQKAVIALTDGHDNASRTTLKGCVDAAKSADVALYTIGLGHAVSETAVRAMADRSGGSFFAAASPSDLTAVYQQIAGQIHNRYEISYSSVHRSSRGPWATVRISLKGSQGPAAEAQYLATGAGTGGAAGEDGIGGAGYAALALVIMNLALVCLLVRRRTLLSAGLWRGTRPLQCPACGSRAVAKIVYGLPRPGYVYGDDVVLGGCVVGERSRDWACKDCGHTWGLGIQQRLRELRDDRR